MTDTTANAPSPDAVLLIPASMLYRRDLPLALRLTWLQLYGLACLTPNAQLETPPLALKEISQLTGKGTSALYHQLAVLRSSGLIQQQNLNDGRIVICFPSSDTLSGSLPPFVPERVATQEEPAQPQPVEDNSETDPFPFDFQERQEAISSFDDSGFVDSTLHETGIDLSLKYLKESKNQLRGVKKREDKFHDSGIVENRNAKLTKPPPDETLRGPVMIYHELTGLHPNKVQRRLLLEQAQDLPRWRDAVTHWLGHHWNPFNIIGMLDLYARGGASGCKHCQGEPEENATQPTPGQEPLATEPIQKLRSKYGIGSG